MPTYEYECKSCRHSFDVFQSIKDEPLKICPECGKELRRIINGGTGIIFKGSGFYTTDRSGGTSVGDTTEGKNKNSADTDKPKTKSSESKACSGCEKAESSSCPKAVNS
jgi:putative FmdB family regulatory protein